MRLHEIWRYPVKSMVGGTVESAELSVLGIVGDRHWAVRSQELGGIRGAKRIGDLMKFSAAYTDGTRVQITLPDGSTVHSDDADVDARISTALGHRVALESLPADGNLDHFRRGPGGGGDPVQELRDIFGREADEPLPDFSAFPPEVVEFESPPGTHYDCWPLLVMTTSAVRSLAAALPGSNTDIRRFRPSLVVDTGGDAGHPEFSWTGRTAVIGGDSGPLIEFLKPCPRCVMTTREVAGGIPADKQVLRHIVRDLDQNLGVYARITRPGPVRTGDEVRFIQ
ncbi:MAG: MOSC domain-containing protein [Actinobacteria bacterium]|nr:MOSC domain-containing protein [Actinomycetota bacterium]